MPRALSASSAVRPPMPPPAMSTLSLLVCDKAAPPGSGKTNAEFDVLQSLGASACGAASSPAQAAFNETSIIPNVYGEPFVKRHGLFFVTVASRHGVVASCVSRKDHDRSAVHQLGQERIRRRAGGGHAGLGACLADLGPLAGRPRCR